MEIKISKRNVQHKISVLKANCVKLDDNKHSIVL
jgi:hypothetical protein